MTNGQTKPKIDDQYWFNLSEELAKSAVTKRDEAAGKLQNLAIWLWGIYTASAAVGFTLSGKALSLGPTILIAAASAGLIAVYWGTVWTQMPHLVNFDPRAPDEIRKAYSALVTSKHRRLRVTLALSVIAAILVSLALLVASVPHKRTDLPDFDAMITKADGQRSLALTGLIVGATEVTVSVQPIGEKEATAPDRGTFRLADGGLLQVNIPLKTPATAVKVTIEWMTQNNTTIQLTKEVKETVHQASGQK